MNKQIEEMARDICRRELEPNCATCYFQDKNCRDLISSEKLYNKGYRKNEWISVDERLPESGVHCLLCCDIKRYDGTHRQYVCDGFYAERWKEECANLYDDDAAIEYNEEKDEYYLLEGWYEVIKNWDEYSSVVIGDFVTHWMPLPQPPKKKYESEGADDD